VRQLTQKFSVESEGGRNTFCPWYYNPNCKNSDGTRYLHGKVKTVNFIIRTVESV
jgi:hypothetical protein